MAPEAQIEKDQEMPVQAPAQGATETQIIGAEEIKAFVTGIEDRFVLQDAKNIDYMYDILFSKNVVKEVRVAENNVDTSVPGKYTIRYEVVVDKDNLAKAQAYITENNINVTAVTEKQDDTKAQEPAAPAHTHTWVEQTSTVHHDATGHYESRQTGTRTVVDKEAWDETVVTGYRCSGRGATK